MPTLSSVDLMDHPFLNLPQGKTSIPGTQHLAANDSRVHEAAAFVVEQYNLRGDEDELYVLTAVVSANLQVCSYKVFMECVIYVIIWFRKKQFYLWF